MLRPNLYLHFLDRELRTSVNWEATQVDLMQAVLSGLSLTQGQLYCSYSHLWESWTLFEKFQSLIKDLVQIGAIVPASDHLDSNEFLSSRVARYGHDRERYPMYFEHHVVHHMLSVQPAFYKSSSATDALSRGLLTWASEQDITSKDLESRAKAAVSKRLDSRHEEAITSSLFQTSSSDNNGILNIIRREISKEYTQHYMDECAADILTGTRGLHFYDDLSVKFPYYDTVIFLGFIRSLGIENHERVILQGIEEVILTKNTPEHLHFIHEWRRLLDVLSHIIFKSNGMTSLAIQRSNLLNELLNLVSKINEKRPVRLTFNRLSEFIELLLNQIAAHYGPTQLSEWESVHRQQSQSEMSDILIVVATDVEISTLIKTLEDRGKALTPKTGFAMPTWVCKLEGMGNLWVVQCEMGPLGQSGSTLTTQDAINEFHPAYVIMSGIAFGLKPDEQNLHDIIVAKWVSDYETAKLTEQETIPRGARPEANAILLALTRTVSRDWEESGYHIGEIVSGCKLVNREEFIIGLRQRFPEAKGGEMEAVGVVSACGRKNVPWVIVKAICDWGMKKDDVGQRMAASNAMLFTCKMLTAFGR